jgi:hypothetical protein
MYRRGHNVAKIGYRYSQTAAIPVPVFRQSPDFRWFCQFASVEGKKIQYVKGYLFIFAGRDACATLWLVNFRLFSAILFGNNTLCMIFMHFCDKKVSQKGKSKIGFCPPVFAISKKIFFRRFSALLRGYLLYCGFP